MKFTVPVSVIPLPSQTVEDMIKDVSKFDDARIHHNALYVLIASENSDVSKNFKSIADDFRERFYFFHM